MLVPSEPVVIDPDVYILALWIPEFELEASVKTLPDAFNLLAVIESIISILSTVAPLIKISSDSAKKTATELMGLGAFIDITETEFEAMHPRFTAVNMYRRMCERENIEFKRNKIVDSIGVFLEKSYEDARTK